MTRREFREVDTLFRNPGKGWMSFQRLPEREPRFPCSVAYFRLNWVEMEPEEGRHDWSKIDEAIAAWGKRGAAVAFRVMTTNAHSAGYYASPKWLFDKGCRFFEYERGGDDPTSGGARIKRIEPDYADPLYLKHHAAFLKVLGRRYDGHPGVEFLDIGSYGIWGEWHTSHPVSLDVRRRIVDMYLDAFKKTPLVMMSDDAETLAYALSKGAGFRRDGVGSPWHEQNWIGSKKYAGIPNFAEVWKQAPPVFEWFGNYEYMQQKQWSVDNALRFMLTNHVALVNDNFGAVPDEAMPKLRDVARRSGYRFVLRSVAYPEQAAPGGSLPVEMQWANIGVGKLYRDFPLTLYLLDGAGKEVQKKRLTQADADPRKWLPGDHRLTTTLALPRGLRPGDYTLAAAFVDAKTGAPAVHIAIDAPETNRRYTLGPVRVARR